MPKKIATEPSVSFCYPFKCILFLPIELCKDVIFYVTNHPVFSTLVCTSIIMIYLILSSPKAQQILASLPYEQFFKNCKSQKMITVYAAVVEVAFELFMAIVLAGVSVAITIWIAFEEKAERKNGDLPYESKRTSSNTESHNDIAFESLQEEANET